LQCRAQFQSSLTPQTITFAPGENYAYINISAPDDALLEPDEEAQLDLFDPADLTTSLGSGVATIQSDENELWIDGGGLMSEDGGSLEFVIHREDLSAAAHQPYTAYVRLKMAGDGDHWATPDDYAFNTMELPITDSDANSVWTAIPFFADQTSYTLTVSAVNDTAVEHEEWFKVVLLGGELAESGLGSAPVLSETLPTQAFGGIADDDSAGFHPYHAWITGPAEALSEHAAQATFTVHRQRDDADVTQPYAMAPRKIVIVKGLSWCGEAIEVGA